MAKYKSIISKKTLVPASIVVSSMMVVAVGVWEYAAFRLEVHDLRAEMRDRTEDRIMRSEFQSWAKLLQAKNQSLDVPECPEPHHNDG